MSDDFDTDYDDESFDDPDDSGTVQKMRSRIKSLEKQAKASVDATERANQAERKALFYEAGLDPNDPKAKYFVKGYDGEMTAEEIRAEAAEAGLITVTESSESVSTDEQAALGRVNNTAGSAESTGEDFASKISLAANEAEVMALLRQSGAPLSEE